MNIEYRISYKGITLTRSWIWSVLTSFELSAFMHKVQWTPNEVWIEAYVDGVYVDCFTIQKYKELKEKEEKEYEE